METVHLPEYYTTTELQNMSEEELRAAQANGFRKSGVGNYPYDLDESHNEVAAKLAPPPSLPQSRPAAEVWGQNEYDFTCPSGATCRLRKLNPEALLELGILDKMTTLPGIAEEQVQKAEGARPKTEMPSGQEIQAVIELMDVLIPAVVVLPQVHAKPKPDPNHPELRTPDRIPGLIYTDSIELPDRIAIMERAVVGVTKLASFREGSS